MLKLRVAFFENPRLLPLLDGAVTPNGLELEFELGHPATLFHRHLKDNAFDVFEFSISDYLIAREKPHLASRQWSALPIFLLKAFLALNTHVNQQSGVTRLRDLKGKRFGMPDFPMTAALWMRIMLKELYGIGPQEVAWYNGRPRSKSHAALLGVDQDPPPGLSLTWLKEGDSLNAMLQAGQIDAAFGDSQIVPITEGPNVRRLFDGDGGRQLIEAFCRKTSVTPINHTVLVQRQLLEREPWVAMALFEAFERSKQEAYRRAREARAAYLLFPGEDFDRQAAIFGDDPYPSGLAANRRMLGLIAQQSFEEGLTRQLANPDDLFWETLRAT